MLERVWRIAATGLCFLTFGTGGVLLGIVVCPLLRLISGDSERCYRQTQAVIHYNFRFFVAMMRTLGIFTLEVQGQERLRRGGQLILSNHPSLIDIVLLISFLPRTNCIVKKALLRNPFTRGPVLGAGYISNHEGPELIHVCVKALDDGDNLIIFPEGTRSVPKQPFSLQRGAANIAVRARCSVTPVVIKINTPFLTKGEKWYRVPPVRPHITVDVKEDVDMNIFNSADTHLSIASRKFTRWLQKYFTDEVRSVAAA